MLKKKKYAKWGNDDGGPDWGDLKHHDKEEEPCLKKVKEVSFTIIHSIHSLPDFLVKRILNEAIYILIHRLI